MHIALWRNDGFLHSFHDFSKSKAFSENLIRTKFILHKTFFQMSMLPSSKTSWLFFNLHSKVTLLGFQHNNYYCHDTGLGFEPIFVKFTWLVRVHIWVNPIVFGNNRLNGNTDMEENVPLKPFFSFIQLVWAFLRKKLRNCVWYPISRRKGSIYFCLLSSRSLKNGDCPRTPQKIIFLHYFGKYVFFFKKIV